jgi:hypothetical protein
MEEVVASRVDGVGTAAIACAPSYITGQLIVVAGGWPAR